MINTIDCWSLGGGGSTVNSERVNSQQWEGQQWGDQQSTVNSERVNGQQWGDRRSMVNSEAIDNQHCWLLILGGRINGQQWGNQWSTVNSEAIDDQHCWLLILGDQQSTVRGSTVSSKVIDDQQSTVRGSMVNSEVIDNQQSTVRGSMSNSEVINDQHCWLSILHFCNKRLSPLLMGGGNGCPLKHSVHSMGWPLVMDYEYVLTAYRGSRYDRTFDCTDIPISYKRILVSTPSMVMFPCIYIFYQNLELQYTTLNSSPSEYKFFVRINHSDELRVAFNIASQRTTS